MHPRSWEGIQALCWQHLSCASTFSSFNVWHEKYFILKNSAGEASLWGEQARRGSASPQQLVEGVCPHIYTLSAGKKQIKNRRGLANVPIAVSLKPTSSNSQGLFKCFLLLLQTPDPLCFWCVDLGFGYAGSVSWEYLWCLSAFPSENVFYTYCAKSVF